MRIVIVGCEYSGTTTLAFKIREWIHEEIGGYVNLVHDHFKFPYTVTHEPEYSAVPVDFTTEEQDQVLALSPRIKETIMRHNVVYHATGLSGKTDKVVIGLHIEDAIYGELYFGYESRRQFMDGIENRILNAGKDAVLCHVSASPEVIRSRMAENPHPNGVLRNPDVELVLERFREEFERSRLCHKIELDTTSATVEETMMEFVGKVEPHLTEHDRERMAEVAAGRTA